MALAMAAEIRAIARPRTHTSIRSPSPKPPANTWVRAARYVVSDGAATRAFAFMLLMDRPAVPLRGTRRPSSSYSQDFMDEGRSPRRSSAAAHD
jgi:hypothetical protein